MLEVPFYGYDKIPYSSSGNTYQSNNEEQEKLSSVLIDTRPKPLKPFISVLFVALLGKLTALFTYISIKILVLKCFWTSWGDDRYYMVSFLFSLVALVLVWGNQTFWTNI